MKHHLISILLPVFNAAPFLEDCLKSILEQSVKNWELIAVDDHSTDESASILHLFQKKSPQKIRVLKNEGKGIIPALRLAYENSQGELITRMDADDLMEKEKLKHLKNILEKNGKGHVATGLVKYFSDTTLGNGYQKYERWLNQLSLKNKNYEDIYKECVIPSPAWMVHRDDLEKCGAFHAHQYPEDYDLCFRFYQKKMKVVAANEVIHLWRDHSTRTSRNDSNYANQHYFDLKLPYFLALDYDKKRPLFIWGAGKKGKHLAKKLVDLNIDFSWVSNNEKKNGKMIYGKLVEHFDKIHAINSPQIIVSVASPEGQVEILNFSKKYDLKNGENVFFFC